MVERMKIHSPERIDGVATAVFREAKNGPAYIRRVSRAAGVPVRVISQKEEAELGARSAAAVSELDRAQVVVWDIGGGSMQISVWNADQKRYEQSLSDVAATVMRKKVLSEIVGAVPGQEKESPNPLGEKNAQKAIEMAESLSRKSVPDSFVNRARRKKWIGIGALHSRGLCELIYGNRSTGCAFDRARLERAVLERSSLTDEQLVSEGFVGSSEFARGAVTNGALVAGYMRAMGVNQVQTLNVSLVEGLLVRE
jgi:exopolyphosphatase/guanosine-5'-triphosphate,3'-diphosphate pyrophosphatase